MEPDFFQRYNKAVIILTLSFSIIVVVVTLSYPNSPIVKILPFVYATISLLITLKAFDQFGVRKAIAERRVKAVLDLSDEIEKTMVTLRCKLKQNPVQAKTAHIYITSSQQATKQEYDRFLNTRVYLEIADQKYFDNLFFSFQKNKFLPHEIKPKLNFISQFGNFIENENHIVGDYSIVYFYKIKPENSCLITSAKNYTLENMLDDFANVLIACEDWINKHTSILN